MMVFLYLFIENVLTFRTLIGKLIVRLQGTPEQNEKKLRKKNEKNEKNEENNIKSYELFFFFSIIHLTNLQAIILKQ